MLGVASGQYNCTSREMSGIVTMPMACRQEGHLPLHKVGSFVSVQPATCSRPGTVQ
jgi:hypothetical protein